MTAPRVLLIGGNGRIAKLMTPLMLAESWHVTSLVRNRQQEDDILKLGQGQAGNGTLEVQFHDLEMTKSEEDAMGLLRREKPDYVVWAAAPDPAHLWLIDERSAKHLITASANTPSVTKFLMISFPAARRARAPWWSDADWEQIQEEKAMFPNNSATKIAADEHLVAMARATGPGFQAISLRPTRLSNGSPTGRVALGKVTVVGQTTRADVAAVAVELLKRDDAKGWFDLVQGDDEISDAVENAVCEGVNCIDGENLTRIYGTLRSM